LKSMDLNFEYDFYPFNGTQLCASEAQEVFFPEEYTDPEIVNRAKQICNQCPLVAECLEYALKTPWLDGIWGATTPRQRSRIRSQRLRLVRRR
jgi:WhiB family redox-sensing transcriptional regulator